MKRAIKDMIACAVIAAAGFAGNSGFAAPASFAYQGVIHELDGSVPATKNRVIEFRLYDGPTSTNVLWARACNVLLDDNGLFNAPLADASGTPLAGVTNSILAEVLAQNSGTTLYVGLTVDGSSGEISPRQAILAVPYAIHADDAAGASGDFPVAGEVTAIGLTVTGPTELKGTTEAASLSVEGKVEITGGEGVFVGPGTIPVGGIIIWSGHADAIPGGWALCDGNNGTPNLSGQFLVGYNPNDGDYNTVGKTGGERTVKLDFSPIVRTSERSANKETVSLSGNDGVSDNGITPVIMEYENRPPYYVICYIMRVK